MLTNPYKINFEEFKFKDKLVDSYVRSKVIKTFGIRIPTFIFHALA